jgi:hypothetical protein
MQHIANSGDALFFLFLSSARLEGMWTEAFDMASAISVGRWSLTYDVQKGR